MPDFGAYKRWLTHSPAPSLSAMWKWVGLLD